MERTTHTARAGLVEPFYEHEIHYLKPETVLRESFGFHIDYIQSNKGIRDTESYRRSRYRLEHELPLDPALIEGVDRKTRHAEVVDGQRRLLAAYDLGMKRVPVVVR